MFELVVYVYLFASATITSDVISEHKFLEDCVNKGEDRVLNLETQLSLAGSGVPAHVWYHCGDGPLT